MKKYNLALTENIIEIMVESGVHFLAGPSDFDMSLHEIAGRVADNAIVGRVGYSAVFRAALSGVAAGLAVGKHLERYRLRKQQPAAQAAE